MRYTADFQEIKLTVPIKNNTVWLNRKQLAELFGRDVKTIGKHINNALKEELDNSVVANFATTASDGKVYQVEHYNLDMIISIGYRVKSNRGVEFRKWANSVLKQYIIQGYAINEKRLEALQRTINIQTKMLACTLEVDEAEVLKAVSLYTNALMLLDQYDHQSLKKPTGSKAIYKMPILYGFYNEGDVRLAVTDAGVVESWKKFFDRGTNWKDFPKVTSYEEYRKITDKQHLSKAKSMPIKFLKASGKGFFIDKDGYALGIRDELTDVIKVDAFKKQMKDIIEYRTMEYYRRRYVEN